VRNLTTARAWQLHLNDGISLERLDALMPKALGVTWDAALASPNMPMCQACTYARQLESVAARWQNGDFGMLQPAVAYPHMVLALIMGEVKKKSGHKELELLGQSSAAHHVAGAPGGNTAGLAGTAVRTLQGGEQAT
jgi:hypothetical protein